MQNIFFLNKPQYKAKIFCRPKEETPFLPAHLSVVEVLIGVRQPAELSGTSIEVDIAGAKRGEEAHLRFPSLHWERAEQEVIFWASALHSHHT